MVLVDEAGDPGDHGGLREAVAGGGAGLEIEHARESNAVRGPAAAVVVEVGGLRRAGGGGRASKVVATADEAGVGRPRVVG